MIFKAVSHRETAFFCLTASAVLSQTADAVWIPVFLTGKKTILRLKLPNMRLRRNAILPCLGLGVSSFVMISTFAAVFF